MLLAELISEGLDSRYVHEVQQVQMKFH